MEESAWVLGADALVAGALHDSSVPIAYTLLCGCICFHLPFARSILVSPVRAGLLFQYKVWIHMRKHTMAKDYV